MPPSATDDPARPVLLVAGIVAALAWARWRTPDLERPLQYDELCTIEFYTWVGLAPDGDPRPLRRAADLDALPRPSLSALAMGLYRALGVWREPNNHVWNSVLVNLALAGHRSAAAARAPAFAGGLCFAGLLFLVCGPLLGWWRAALVVPLWGLGSPYVVGYGASARGYTWMLALDVALVGAVVIAARRPRSIVRAALLVALAVLASVNVTSMLIDRVLPIYLAAALAPPERVDPAAWRRSVAAELLALAGIAGVFFVDRLPYVASALRLYGDPLGAAPAALDVLFPTAGWKTIGVLGVAGTLGLLATPRVRWLGLAGVLTVGATALHGVLAGRLPYARTLGFLLAPALLAAAFAVDEAFRRVRGVAAAVVVAGVAALTVVVLLASLRARADADPRVPALVALAGAAAPLPGADYDYAVLPHTSDYHLDKFLPASWHDERDVLEPGDVAALRVLLEERDGWGTETQRARSQETRWRPFDCDRIGCSAPVGRWRLASLAGAVRPFAADDPPPAADALVVWYPARDRLGIDAHALLDAVDAGGVPYVRRNVREAVKLDYVGRLHALEFWVGSAAEWARVRSVVAAGLARFGGSAVVVDHST